MKRCCHMASGASLGDSRKAVGWFSSAVIWLQLRLAFFERCWLSVANWRAPTPQLEGAATFQPHVPEQVSPLLRRRLRARQCDATFPRAHCRRDRPVQLTLIGGRAVGGLQGGHRSGPVEPRIQVLAAMRRSSRRSRRLTRPTKRSI